MLRDLEQNKNINNDFICLWFPYLLVEISFRKHVKFKTAAFAITSQKGNKQILCSINPIGELLGLKLGMSLSEAHILCENLITEQYSYQKKEAFMLNQAKWCGQLTPRISIEKENTLILNLKGCTHLFGNITDVIEKIQSHFKKINISILFNSGTNITTTRALTKFNINECTRKKYSIIDSCSDSININSSEKIQNNLNFLKKIPIEALELDPSEKKELKYLGIETVYHLHNIPHKDLLIRFGPKLVKTLKKFNNVNHEPMVYLKPENIFSRSISLPEPINLITDVIKLFEKLTKAICNYLKNMNKGTRTLIFQITRTDHTKQLIQIKTSEITAKPEKFIMLFTLKVNQIEVGFGIDFIRVSAQKVENLFSIQESLQINSIRKDNTIHQILKKEKYKNLISRLSNKIGFDSLIHLHPSESHIPENNVQKVSAVYCGPKLYWPIPLYERPLLIFKPEKIKIIEYENFLKLFIWRGKQYNINAKFGPERLAAEWWLDSPQWRTGLRDYWKIETTCGIRLWLFEAKGAELKGGWYIHGNFI